MLRMVRIAPAYRAHRSLANLQCSSLSLGLGYAAVMNDKSHSKLQEARQRVLIEIGLDQNRISGDLFRWTLASLLLVNGGAIVALLGVDGINVILFEEAGWFFAGGMLAALVGGFIWSFAFGHLANDYIKRACSGAMLTDKDIDRPGIDRTTHRLMGIATTLWILSLGGFISGAMLASDLPKYAEGDELTRQLHDATLKLGAESERLTKLVTEKSVTKMEIDAAIKRADAAQMEASILAAKLRQHAEEQGYIRSDGDPAN